MGAELFLRELIKEFYRSTEITTVPDIASREFGIGSFGKKISNRHLEFKNNSSLNFYLRQKSPFYISYSNAHYKFPSARPMEKKDLIGADIIYEFDADDIKTDCKIEHDSWKCSSCGAIGKGNIKECPECGSGVKVSEWVCSECIGETKRQTIKLMKLLENDFSFTDGISLNFSGSKGFHLHVRSESIQSLSKNARLELLDYITGTNINLTSLGFLSNQRKFLCPKKSNAKAWAKKILCSIEYLFDEGDASKIAAMASRDKFSFSTNKAKKLLKEKSKIFKAMDVGVLLFIPKVSNEKFWSALINSIIEDELLMVDRQTSVDINKIIRVPNTIHGSTGLQAKEVSIEGIKKFDALKECVVMSSKELALLNVVAPKFYLNGETFGPFNKEEVSLPTYAGFFLLARGNAELR